MSDENPHPHGRAPSTTTAYSQLEPCPRCSTPTQRAALAQYGARCWRCYEAFCAEPQPKPLHMGDKRGPAGDKAWAYALRDRERDGQRLGPAVHAMWRAALGDARLLTDLASRS